MLALGRALVGLFLARQAARPSAALYQQEGQRYQRAEVRTSEVGTALWEGVVPPRGGPGGGSCAGGSGSATRSGARALQWLQSRRGRSASCARRWPTPRHGCSSRTPMTGRRVRGRRCGWWMPWGQRRAGFWSKHRPPTRTGRFWSSKSMAECADDQRQEQRVDLGIQIAETEERVMTQARQDPTFDHFQLWLYHAGFWPALDARTCDPRSSQAVFASTSPRRRCSYSPPARRRRCAPHGSHRYRGRRPAPSARRSRRTGRAGRPAVRRYRMNSFSPARWGWRMTKSTRAL
jgi:hypothetical protein